MRIAVPVFAAAVLAFAPAVLAGCSTGVVGTVRTSPPLTPIGVPGTSGAPVRGAGPSSPTSARAAQPPPASASAPGPEAEVADVAAWVAAGAPVAESGFHTATRDGQPTELDDSVAFVVGSVTTKSGPLPVANCITNPYADGALACLVALTNPPPRPTGFETGWKANWVDFTGTGVDVGSPHGDPGPFVAGTGAPLPPGSTLTFGDYRCRADTAAVVCLHAGSPSSGDLAVRMAADGVTGYGCLRRANPTPDVGISLRC